MKNLHRILFFSILVLFASCKKESDVTTTDTSTPPPAQGDTYIVQGIVKDTLSNPLGGVSLKAYFDDLEMETMTDMDGNYEFKVPLSKTDGYVVAAKEQYTRAIKQVKQEPILVRKNIVLAFDRSVDGVDLGLQTDSLLTIVGGILDVDDQPLENISAKFFALNLVPTPEVVFGSDETDANGRFEIIVEYKDWFSYVSVIANLPTLCASRGSVFWQVDGLFKDVGTIVLEDGADLEDVFSTNLSVTNCGSLDPKGKIYFTESLTYAKHELPLGQIESPYCIYSEMVYLGAYNSDKTEFNGVFQPSGDLSDNIDLDLCTPNGYFLEVTLKDQTTVFTGNITYDGTIGLQYQDVDNLYLFTLRGKARRTVGDVTVLYFGDVATAAHIQNPSKIFELDYDSPSFVNFVEDTDQLISGVIDAKVKMEADGSIEPIQIRFRASKQ